MAERAGVDRSTLTQLLSPRNQRLPRLDTVVALAHDQNVSIDWLVGLSNEGPMQAKMIDTEFARSEHVHDDERLLSWFAETVGHKVRHVPSSIPDLVKTDAVIRFESTRRDDATVETGARVDASAARLALTSSPAAEIEVCSAYQAITAIALGEGIWSRLSLADRKEQLDQIAELTGELYPRFRWFLFDGSMRYAAPVTIFGPLRAALYLGHNYLVLTSAGTRPSAHPRLRRADQGRHRSATRRRQIRRPPQTPIVGNLSAVVLRRSGRVALFHGQVPRSGRRVESPPCGQEGRPLTDRSLRSPHHWPLRDGPCRRAGSVSRRTATAT